MADISDLKVRLISSSTGNIQFCNDPIWDLNATWYTDQPDFTKCFHSTILVYLPCIFLWINMPFKLYEWKNQNASQASNGPSKLTRIFFLRLVLQLLLFFISNCAFVINIHEILKYSIQGLYEKPLSEVMEPAILCLTFVLCLTVSIIDRRNGIQSSSGMQFGFWFFLIISATFTVTSVVRFPEKRSSANNVIFLIYYFHVSIAFLLEFWSNPTPNYVCIGGE